jgi:hypothetical protein
MPGERVKLLMKFTDHTGLYIYSLPHPGARRPRDDAQLLGARVMRAASPEDAIASKIISYLQEGAMRRDVSVLRCLAGVRTRVMGRHYAGHDNPAPSGSNLTLRN